MTTKEDDDRSIRVSNTACSGEFELLDFSCSDDSDEQTEVEISETLNGVNSFDERKEDERAIFQKARQYLNPGCFFRSIVYFYAERKIIVFFWIHFVCTLVIWGKSVSILQTRFRSIQI